MMEWTDRHWRVFARTLTQKALLYTEMVTAQALIHGDLERLTAHSPAEYPLALQLGGSNPEELFEATCRVKHLGFDEIKPVRQPAGNWRSFRGQTEGFDPGISMIIRPARPFRAG